MPANPAVNYERLLEGLKLFDRVLNADGSVPVPSNDIWVEISQHFNGIIKPKNIYTNVLQNRNGILDELKKHFHFSPCLQSADLGLESSESDNNDSENSSNSEEDIIRPKRTFILIVSQSEWENIKPIAKIRKRKDRPSGQKISHILPPREWGNIFVRLCWEQHKLPCPYSFKAPQVSTDIANRQWFIKIQGKCQECGAEGEGVILNEPQPGESVKISWKVEDTRDVPHESKRFLTGKERERVGKELRYQSADVYRRNVARQTMDFGDPEPPHLRSTEVYRKAKQEMRDKEFPFKGKTNPFDGLLQLKYSESYAGSIHFIAVDPVIVHYHTPSQLIMYKEFARKQHSVIAIDATGSLIKKIQRPNGLSGHIFLYEIVIRSEKQLPVLQMLSEKNDSNTIMYWINEWIRVGAPRPREVVCDGSRALLSASAHSFSQCKDLGEYKSRCFELASGRTVNLPACYIRLDVAHIINTVRNWKVWKDGSAKLVKDFYLRCFGLLIQADSLKKFEDLLKHILTLCFAKRYGHLDGDATPAELSEKFLVKEIGGLSDEITGNLITEGKIIEEEEKDEEEDDDSKTDDHEDCPKNLKTWLENIKSRATYRAQTEGDRISPYYSEKVANSFLTLTSDFVLWSAVLIQIFKSPNLKASSAMVESDFGDLKNRILKNESRPMALHKFVVVHLNAIEGQMKIAQAASGNSTNPKEPKKKKLKKVHEKDTETIPMSEDELPLSCDDLTFYSDVEIDFTCFKESDLPVFDEEDGYNGIVDKSICKYVSHGKDSNKSNSQEEPLLDIIDEKPSEDSLSDEESSNLSICDEKSPSDLNFIENWRGMAEKTANRRESRYLKKCPEILAAQAAEKLKEPSSKLLINGNLFNTPVDIENDVRIAVYNTCIFDSIVQILVQGFIDLESIRNIMLSAENETLKTAVLLGTVGAVSETYQQRGRAVMDNFAISKYIPLPSKCKYQVPVYDCYGNLFLVAKSLLSDVPSATFSYHCKSCSKDKNEDQVILDVYMPPIEEHGLKKLLQSIQILLDDSHRLKCPSCQNEHLERNGCTLGKFLFVDISLLTRKGASDVLLRKSKKGDITWKDTYKGIYSLQEIPTNIELDEKRYRLIGVVAYKSIRSHYVAYTRRANGLWDFWDDLAKNKKGRKNIDAKIKPHLHLIIYAVEE